MSLLYILIFNFYFYYYKNLFLINIDINILILFFIKKNNILKTHHETANVLNIF